MEIPKTQNIILEDGNQYVIDDNVVLLTENDGCIYIPLENQRIMQQNVEKTSNALRETENTINTHCTSAAEINDKNYFIWNEKTILLMLEEYKKRVERFRNPKGKKKQLWKEISNEMAKYGYIVEPDAIDKKFRNMKSRYLTIKDNNDKKKTTGTDRISWTYFDIMSEIFFDDKTVNPNLVMASTLNNDNNKDNNKKTKEIVRNSISSPSVSDQENENLSPGCSSSTSSPSIFKNRKKSIFENKKIGKRRTPIDSYRNKYMQVEERSCDFKRLIEAVESNNAIQKGKLEVLRKYLSSQEKS